MRPLFTLLGETALGVYYSYMHDTKELKFSRNKTTSPIGRGPTL